MERVANLDTNTRLRVLETAVLVGSEDLSRPCRASLLRSMWTHTPDACDATAVWNPAKALAFGKKAHDKEIMGAAYYAIMCKGREWWTSHHEIDLVDRCRLTEGMMRCSKEWHDIQTKWAADGFGCHLKCAPKRDALDASLRIQAQRGVAWYDVVGKIDATLAGNPGLTGNSCDSRIAGTIVDELHRVRSELYDYFSEKM